MPQPEADGRACGACAGVWTTGVAGAGRATGLAAAAGLAERGTPQPLRLRPSRAGPVAAGGRLAGAFELGPKGLGAAARGPWQRLREREPDGPRRASRARLLRLAEAGRGDSRNPPAGQMHMP